MNQRLLQDCLEELSNGGFPLTGGGENGILGGMNTSKKIIKTALAELAKDDSTGYEAICEMATLDSFMAKPKGGKRLWVAIRQNEKQYPHIHIYDKAGKDRTTDNMVGFHTCVHLDAAQYFHHDCYTDYLDSHQLRALARFLLSPVSPKTEERREDETTGSMP